jgi:hypothetical protein
MVLPHHQCVDLRLRQHRAAFERGGNTLNCRPVLIHQRRRSPSADVDERRSPVSTDMSQGAAERIIFIGRAGPDLSTSRTPSSSTTDARSPNVYFEDEPGRRAA